MTRRLRMLRAGRTVLCDDTGSSTVELVLVTPLLVMLGLFVVLCGRLVAVQLDVDAAAHAAARAASLARTPAAATRDATAAARDTLAGRASCPQPTVTVDVGGFRPGGSVTVTLVCEVPLADLSLLSVGGHRAVTSRASAPVDTYRGAVT